MSNQADRDSVASHCSTSFAVALEVLDSHKREDQQFWAKVIYTPALPPVGCTIFADSGPTGVLVVRHVWFCEKRRMFTLSCEVEEVLPFAESGWTRANAAEDLFGD